MKTGIIAQQSGKENPTNLLSNGDFENWSAGTAVAPDGWTVQGGGTTITREATIIKISTYSAKLSNSANPNSVILQDVSTNKGINYWKGRTVTLGCWIYASNANSFRISIDDGSSEDYTDYHSGNSTWQFLTITKTLSASATTVTVRVRGDIQNNIGYVDGFILVEGSSIFAFADKPATTSGWVNLPVPTFDTTYYDNGSGGQPTTTEFRMCINGRVVTVHYKGTGVKAGTNNIIVLSAAAIPTPINTSIVALIGQAYIEGPAIGGSFLYATNPYVIISNANISDNTTIVGLSFILTYEI